jgi:hypothetical protein
MNCRARTRFCRERQAPWRGPGRCASRRAGARAWPRSDCAGGARVVPGRHAAAGRTRAGPDRRVVTLRRFWPSRCHIVPVPARQCSDGRDSRVFPGSAPPAAGGHPITSGTHDTLGTHLILECSRESAYAARSSLARRRAAARRDSCHHAPLLFCGGRGAHPLGTENLSYHDIYVNLPPGRGRGAAGRSAGCQAERRRPW